VLEVNAIYFILLIEGFGILLFLVLLGILITVLRLRRKGRNVEHLAARLKHRGQQRDQHNIAFLQAVYHLEDQDLQTALQNIGKHETDFFELLAASLRHGKTEHIAALDAALDRVIESYKCLQPRAETQHPEARQNLREITELRGQNDALRSELSLAEARLSDMIAEFGSMFGGGKDHELDIHQLKKKLAGLQEAGSIIDT